MKKLVIAFILFSMLAAAQVPNKMSFQTVVRNNLGKLVVNKSIGVRLSILQTTSNGTAVYVETHSKTSNVNGLLTLEVGTGTVTSGTFATIDWTQGPYFLKTELDVNGGTNYTITGVTEFVSVPYAFSTNSVKTLSNGTNIGDMNYWDGTTWVPLKRGIEGQFLIFCDGKPTWGNEGICPDPIKSLDCINASNNGILIANSSSVGVSSLISYTEGNGGFHNGQVISSSGVTGLTATLIPGSFSNGNGSLTYSISGIPSTSGTASFTINIGGKNCILTRNVLTQVGSITSLDCISPSNIGTLTAGIASNSKSILNYSGGNNGVHPGQIVASTGVLGLTATLNSGNFTNGNGSLSYTITGIPLSNGSANFAIYIGGKMCSLTRVVAPTSGNGPNISDIDGNTYKTVYIGSQLWMEENLNTTKYNNSLGIPLITDNIQWQNNNSGAWAYYNNDINNAKYGKLYNWYAISPTTNGNNNICPTGWHVPTDNDWTTLTNYLGGENISGGKMKEVGTTNWNSPNYNAVNSSLYTGLPGGLRKNTGEFNNINFYGYWWSSSEYNSNNSWVRFLSTNDTFTTRTNILKSNGLSIRCIKD